MQNVDADGISNEQLEQLDINDEINNDNPEFNIEENVVGDDDGSNYSDDDEQEPDILEPQYTEKYKLKGTSFHVHFQAAIQQYKLCQLEGRNPELHFNF